MISGTIPLTASPARRLSRRTMRTIGALVLAGGTLVLNLWFWGATVRDEPILIVVREVPAGQPLAAEDLGRRDGRLPAETKARAIPAAQAHTLVGQLAAHRLAPGDPLTAASVTAAPRPAAGQVAVAVGLKPELTPEIATGSRVAVIGLGRGGAGDERAVLARGAVVQSIAYAAPSLTAPLGPGATTAARASRTPSGVVLLVSAPEAGPVLAAAAAGGVALALLPDEAAPATGGQP